MECEKAKLLTLEIFEYTHFSRLIRRQDGMLLSLGKGARSACALAKYRFIVAVALVGLTRSGRSIVLNFG